MSSYRLKPEISSVPHFLPVSPYFPNLSDLYFPEKIYTSSAYTSFFTCYFLSLLISASHNLLTCIFFCPFGITCCTLCSVPMAIWFHLCFFLFSPTFLLLFISPSFLRSVSARFNLLLLFLLPVKDKWLTVQIWTKHENFEYVNVLSSVKWRVKIELTQLQVSSRGERRVSGWIIHSLIIIIIIIHWIYIYI